MGFANMRPLIEKNSERNAMDYFVVLNSVSLKLIRRHGKQNL